METVNPVCQAQSSVSTEAVTLFVSPELSRARWLVTSLSPGSSKISQHSVVGGDSRDLLQLLTDLRMKAERHIGATVKVVTIQEIGFDGFWIHRVVAHNQPRRRSRPKAPRRSRQGGSVLRLLLTDRRTRASRREDASPAQRRHPQLVRKSNHAMHRSVRYPNQQIRSNPIVNRSLQCRFRSNPSSITLTIRSKDSAIQFTNEIISIKSPHTPMPLGKRLRYQLFWWTWI